MLYFRDTLKTPHTTKILCVVYYFKITKININIKYEFKISDSDMFISYFFKKSHQRVGVMSVPCNLDSSYIPRGSYPSSLRVTTDRATNPYTSSLHITRDRGTKVYK